MLVTVQTQPDVPNQPSLAWSGTRLGRRPHSVTTAAGTAVTTFLSTCKHLVPPEIINQVQNVSFTTSPGVRDVPLFPCPLRQQEATAAIKALEASAVAELADLRYGRADRQIQIDVGRVGCYLMSTYVTTFNALNKTHPGINSRIPDTDLYKAQSILYRRLSANLYRTKNPGEYYHIHGSLDASETLKMLGLPPHCPGLTGYRECLRTIGSAVRKFSTDELEVMNAVKRQAGAPCLTADEFLRTPHGHAMSQQPPFTLSPLEAETEPIPFPAEQPDRPRQPLTGIRVLELCRVIAGPTIGRALAAYGADVLKVTSPKLPDVSFFQLDVNTGKHATSLDLSSHADRAIFEDLVATADVIIDGYRPGALERMGYGAQQLSKVAKRRGKGIVYVSEDCFGGSGLPPTAGTDWADRPGWQQIADCVTGVAWEQGRFMGLDEPVIPPFPMSDYGTGALGCVAALLGLHKRATQGGSWYGRTSLVQYDMFLLSLGTYPQSTQHELRRSHDDAFFHLRHDDSVDEVGKRALASVKRLHPILFKKTNMQSAWSPGFEAVLSWPRGALSVEGLKIGFLRASRPNGFDDPTWDHWEVDHEMLDG